MNALTHALRSSPFFPEVSKLSPVRRFHCLFSQGQNAEALFIIEEGLVKETRTNRGGDRIILAMSGPGDVVGEEAMGSGSLYANDADVLSSTGTLYRIPRETLSKMVTQDHTFSKLFIESVLKRHKTLSEKVELLCLHDVEYRILTCLADLSELVPTIGEGHQIPITQAELADLIGATRETTSTTLNQLEKRGLIKLSRRLLTVPLGAKLRDEAQHISQA